MKRLEALRPVEGEEEDDYVFPGWLYNLPVIQGVKERQLSGYPTFYPIADDIAANDEEEYTVAVDENRVWLVDTFSSVDILPDLFYITLTVGDQPVLARQLLRMPIMDVSFPTPFPCTGGIYLKIENPTGNIATYQAVLRYREFVRSTFNRSLEFLGLEKI